ncbi:MAG: mechanosensitive ion channel family protein [Gammaproteobacteria bacterium]
MTRRSRPRLLVLTLFALALATGGHAAGAQVNGTTPAEAAAAQPDTPPPIPDTLASPRATMESFLEAMQAVRDGDAGAMSAAIATLDLDAVSPLVRDEKGAELAWMLTEVVKLTREPDTARFSTRASGEPFVFQTYDAGRLSIEFEDGVGWRFSAETVAALPAILDELIAAQKAEGTDVATLVDLPLGVRLRASVPPRLREVGLILEHWQWLGILVIILAGMVVDKIVAWLLRMFARSWRQRFAEGSFRDVDDTILRPLGLMAMAIVWWTGLNLLGLPASALVVLLVTVKFLACLSAVWGAYRLVDLLSAFLLNKAHMTESKLDDALVPLVTRTMKVFVTVMGVIFIADNLDVDVTSLLAGLGLGGLAFALAAKDVAGNLFGSITVLLDQTFHVGDWVVIGDVEGTVERIGFRSTRIRTFYNSLVSVPNSTLITANVDNMGKREYRRLSCKYGIAYDTPPDRIDAFCEGLRELVRQHPYMRKDNFHVYLNGLGDSSLEILVYVFWRTPDWGTELRERHRFLLDSLRLAERLGVEFAFPTQTIYTKPGDPTPLPVPADPFTPAASEADAQGRGRGEARAIVAATLGVGVVPPPAGTSAGDEDGDGDG